MKVFDLLVVLATISVAQGSMASVNTARSTKLTPARTSSKPIVSPVQSSGSSSVPTVKEEGGCPLAKASAHKMHDNTTFVASNAKVVPVHEQRGADSQRP